MPTGVLHSRRQFLQSTAALAACGLARRARAAKAPGTPFIDTHVYLGRWPFARFPADEPRALVEALRGYGVTSAWAGSFDALFHKDLDGVNRRLVETCKSAGSGIFIPMGTINPTLPDWEEDVRRCHEKYRMPGVRLHPNYHGYTLGDPRFGRLLALATERKLLVQLVASVADESHSLLNPSSLRVDLAPLPKIVQSCVSLRLLVSGAESESTRELLRSDANPQAYFDVASIAKSESGRDALRSAPRDRMVFGSAMPLNSAAGVFAALRVDNLSTDQWAALASGNAARLLEPSSKTGG